MLKYQNKTEFLEQRFKKYVQIDTQSDPSSTSSPSTEKQKDLGRVLVQELLEIGLADARIEFGYQRPHGQGVLSARLVEGTFPDYEEAFGNVGATRLVIPTKEFAQSMKLYH